MKYDVLIIGAGPSGLFCAYELSRASNARVAVLDAGKPYAEKKCPLLTERRCAGCKPCSTLCGEGGAAFFHPGKLSFYPAGSGLKNILPSEEACIGIYERVKSIFEKYGVILENRDQTGTRYFDSCRKNGLEIKYYNSVPVREADFQQFMTLFGRELRGRATMLFETEVLTVERGDFWRVKATQKGNVVEYEADKLVIAAGEYGFRWWKRIAGELGVRFSEQKVDIGVRIECPSRTIEKIWPFHKDFKAKINAPDGSELRTYCVLKNGRSVFCHYGDYIVLDGVADESNSVAGITIFNRLGKKHLNGVEPISYAISLLAEFYRVHAKPAGLDMAGFLGAGTARRPSYCTLRELERSDGARELPRFIRENLMFGIESFDRLIPGLADESNGVLLPVIDNLWRAVDLTARMESSVPGLYVTGDATGQMRGIMQACVTGVLCADGIMEEM